jgi:hypothetical protein
MAPDKKTTIASLSVLWLVVYFGSGMPAVASTLARGSGTGPTESAALINAKRDAIARVCGETILGSVRLQTKNEKTRTIDKSGNLSKSFEAESKVAEDDQSLVGARVRDVRINNVSQKNGVFVVEIQAEVSECKKSSELVEANKGTDVVNALRQMNKELMKIGTSDALISHPKSLAEKYHNARILLQRGEVDRALRAYEDVLSSPLRFADAMSDYTSILARLYGPSGAVKYIDERRSGALPLMAREYAKLTLNKSKIKDERYILDIDKIISADVEFLESFPPFSLLVLSRVENYVDDRDAFGPEAWRVLGKMSKIVTDSIASGDYYAFYFDPSRADKDVQLIDLTNYTSGNKSFDKLFGEWSIYKNCSRTRAGMRSKFSSGGYSHYARNPPMALAEISESSGEITASFFEINRNGVEACVAFRFSSLNDSGAEVTWRSTNSLAGGVSACKNKQPQTGQIYKQYFYRCSYF